MADEKRDFIIAEVVALLQPSELSEDDLRRVIAEEIDFSKDAWAQFDEEQKEYPSPPSKAEARRQADDFIDAAKRTLAASEAFSREYKAPLLDYLIRMNGQHHSRFTAVLREMIGIVEKERRAFAQMIGPHGVVRGEC